MKNIFIISTLLILGSSFLLSEEGCIQDYIGEQDTSECPED